MIMSVKKDMLAFKQKFKVWQWKIMIYKLENSLPLVANQGEAGTGSYSDSEKYPLQRSNQTKSILKQFYPLKR